MEDDWLSGFWADWVFVVQKHLGQSGVDVEWLADRFMSHGMLNGPANSVFDRPRDVAALTRVDHALREIERALSDSSLTSAASDLLLTKLLFGPQAGKIHSQDTLNAYLEEHGRRSAGAFKLIASEPGVLRDAVKAAITDIEQSALATRSFGQMNLEAIAVVEGCRWVWKQATGRDAPSKDLNLATKFAAFLADVMDVCNVEGDPRSALKAWARLQENP